MHWHFTVHRISYLYLTSQRGPGPGRIQKKVHEEVVFEAVVACLPVSSPGSLNERVNMPLKKLLR